MLKREKVKKKVDKGSPLWSNLGKERRSQMNGLLLRYQNFRKLQAQIKKFSWTVTREFKKPDRKWIGEIIYGILKSKDVKLANIGRATR